MPDTKATRLMVTKAWQAVTREKQKILDKEATASQYKLETARYNLRRAIEQWEKPGQSDTFGWTEPKREKFLDKLKKKFGKTD